MYRTFPWMSPEIIQGQEVNKKCDIWSYGVVRNFCLFIAYS
jgi:serine/threonine protein kinase